MAEMNYKSLPKMRDSLSLVYVEHCVLERTNSSVSAFDKDGSTEIPISNTCVVVIGPGSKVTHEAVKVMAENGCLAIWTGEEGVRYYAHGTGETKKGYKIERHARVWADEEAHMQVVRAMYFMRLGIEFNDSLTLQQLRGMEGARVRDEYFNASKKYGVTWTGRSYNNKSWKDSDPVNQALSTANSCLYGVCHSAIIAAGYSPSLGFIHSGNIISFVFDIADLYKSEISIPMAFEIAKSGESDIGSAIRRKIRDYFRETKLMKRIIPDIEWLMMIGEGKTTIKRSKLSEDFENESIDDINPYAAKSYWEPGSKFSEPKNSSKSDPNF